MQRHDVIIVGGGPAGSSCARRLCRTGLDVLVIDKCLFPRDKPCAGWVTPPVFDLLDLDPAEYGCDHVLQPITGFGVARLGGPLVANHYGRVVSYGIRRCEFDHLLLQRSGAHYRLGESVIALERSTAAWRVNGRYEAPIVVGAGGHFCPVARRLGAKAGGANTVVAAQEAELKLTNRQEADCAVSPTLPELYFCEDLQGYAWCFRKGKYLNIGLGREDSRVLSRHLRKFLDFLERAGRIPSDLAPVFRGHAYCLYAHAPRPWVGDGLLTVGDAAGLAAARSGEGIRAAVESGQLAAETILAAAGRPDREALQDYPRRLVARFGRPEYADGWLRFIPAGWKRTAAGPLFASSWFTRHMVIERWFLGPKSPARPSG